MKVIIESSWNNYVQEMTGNINIQFNHNMTALETHSNYKLYVLFSVIDIVCQLIDVSEIGKECVDELFDDFVTSISHCLHSYCQQV